MKTFMQFIQEVADQIALDDDDEAAAGFEQFFFQKKHLRVGSRDGLPLWKEAILERVLNKDLSEEERQWWDDRVTIEAPRPTPSDFWKLHSENLELMAELSRAEKETLRVVPVGNPCRVGDLVYDILCFEASGQVYARYGDGEYTQENDAGVFEAVVLGGDVSMAKFHGDAIVQPVRIERWTSDGARGFVDNSEGRE